MTGGSGPGISPRLGADDLVGSLARAAGVGVRPATLQRVGSSSLTPTHLLDALGWAEQQVDDGAVGAVISQGTDTLEETAYFWDLLWDRPQPFLVTAAMRGPEQPGADGPANVLAALTVAADPRARDRGVLTVLDDQVHRARWVRKAHTSLTGAFESTGVGPVAVLAEGTAHWLTVPRRQPPLGLDRVRPPNAAEEWPWVPLIGSHLDDTGRLARAAAEAGAAALVIAGTGAGHVSEAAADALGTLAERIPVVLASRTLAGPVFERTYGYPGAEIDLIGRGLIAAGWLAPLKVRLLVQLLLAGGADRAGMAAEVARRGSLPA
ncbi:L-asparaginase [Enemella dayhoffiae]|uniref:L-asparaginase n=2 Tax=Enemella dayhoffiae TaxID=2016507 RepID=A0A255GSE4_9ACTN|nr:L-asparaginase [Enemella dayhoffiae]